MTHQASTRPLTSLRFCPFQDILTIGHSAGLSSILIPGSGEANFDSSEADPFEHNKSWREREVKSLLDKLQPDMISLDPEFLGTMAPASKLSVDVDGKPQLVRPGVPFKKLTRIERLRADGKADETELGLHDDEKMVDEDEEDATGQGGKRLTQFEREEKEKLKMRGKGKSMKRYLRKKRKNVIDPTTVRFLIVFSFLTFSHHYQRLFRWLSEPNWRNRGRKRS